MFDGITRKEWERWESAERCFRAHPKFYRFKLALLFAEGVVVGLLLFALVAWLVALCVMHPGKCVRLIAFLVINLFITARIYYAIITQRPWTGLPELRAEDWPRLHELVRETAEAVGAPRIHRIFLQPVDFNASVCSAFPLVPGLRRNMLILGYPLLAAFGERGLRGVLAHELGHVAHHDTVHGGALLHVRVFWMSVQLGIFTWVLNPWRRSYLGRIDRLMSPLERERELAADRSAAQLFGADTLRDALVTTKLRGPDADMEEIFRPLAVSEPGAPTSPAEAIRAAMRRAIPADEARRRIERAMRSIVPPMEPHPPLAVRTGASSADELLPFASVPQDALEGIFGSAGVLDSDIDELLHPAIDEMAESIREIRERNEKILDSVRDDETATPDEILERAMALNSLGRKDEAVAVVRAGRAAHPGNAALETAELSDRLSKAASVEEGAPIADRLEQLIEKEPMMRLWAEDLLFVQYLEIGAVDRIKNLLDLRQHGEKALLRRLNAKLKPKDDIRAEPLSDGERKNLSEAFAGRPVREVYAVRRVYEGTGTSSSYLVVRWSRFAFYNPQEQLAELNEVFDSFMVIAGTRALFRRFEELGIAPIPVPKKAPKPEGRD
jgi:Zn-dependent protease with chaperone function